MSEAMSHAEWICTWLGLAMDISYDIRERDKLNSEIRLASITKEPQKLSIAGITDAKSLYDNTNREQHAKAEKRAAFEICVIRDSLRSMNGQVIWISHEENPADCLIKLKGNVSRLVVLMQNSKYQLLCVEDD